MSRIVAIGSGKGGVGKTWLAVSLAHALARLGRRVLLFDGDLGLANVDVQLGLDPGPDLAGVLTGRCTFAQAVRRFEPGGFDRDRRPFRLRPAGAPSRRALWRPCSRSCARSPRR